MLPFSQGKRGSATETPQKRIVFHCQVKRQVKHFGSLHDLLRRRKRENEVVSRAKPLSKNSHRLPFPSRQMGRTLAHAAQGFFENLPFLPFLPFVFFEIFFFDFVNSNFESDSNSNLSLSIFLEGRRGMPRRRSKNPSFFPAR
jgi:hypothetical protein